MEAAPRFELGIKDLQSSALPLGYAAVTRESITIITCGVKETMGKFVLISWIRHFWQYCEMLYAE